MIMGKHFEPRAGRQHEVSILASDGVDATGNKDWGRIAAPDVIEIFHG